MPRLPVFLVPLVLAALVVATHLPALRQATWRGTESRRVEIALEMLDERAPDPPGVVPTLGLEPTYAKPPFYYQLLALVARFVGRSKEAFRAPSLVGLWLLSWLAWHLLRRRHGATAAWIAAAGVVTSGAMLETASQAEIDPLFACLTVGSVLLFADSVQEHGSMSWRKVVLAGLVGGVAMLTKGPPWFLFAAGAVYAVRRRENGLRAAGLWAGLAVVPLVAWGLVLFAVAPQESEAARAVADAAAASGQEEWFVAYLFRETLGRFLSGWRADAPLKLLEYLATIAACLMAVLPTFRPRATRTPFDRVLLLSAVFAFASFLLLPHRALRYFLPAIPIAICALAPDAARFVARGGGVPDPVMRFGRIVGLIGAVFVVVVAFADHPMAARLPVLGVVLASVPLWLRTRCTALAFLLVTLPVAVSWTVLADLAVIQSRGVRSTERIAAVFANYLSAEERPLLGTHFHPPSQLFVELGIVPTGGDEESADGTLEEPVVLLEELFGPLSEQQAAARVGYRPRVRVVGRNRGFVLLERVNGQ